METPMTTAELTDTVAGDRRVDSRLEYVRPCKIFSPALQKYFMGSTQDISTGGMLVHVPQLIDVRPGDVLHIGVASKRREQFLRSVEMLQATVLRSMKTVDDHTTFAVKFDQEQTTVQIGTLRMAA
jgi:c-di-GMP-binding flagellar brake protein YcgR